MSRFIAWQPCPCSETGLYCGWPLRQGQVLLPWAFSAAQMPLLLHGVCCGDVLLLMSVLVETLSNPFMSGNKSERPRVPVPSIAGPVRLDTLNQEGGLLLARLQSHLHGVLKHCICSRRSEERFPLTSCVILTVRPGALNLSALLSSSFLDCRRTAR